MKKLCFRTQLFFSYSSQCLQRLTWKSSWDASQAACNRNKNRYRNIVACKIYFRALNTGSFKQFFYEKDVFVLY